MEAKVKKERSQVVLVVPENGDICAAYRVSQEVYDKFDTLMACEKWNEAADHIRQNGKVCFTPDRQVFEV